MNNEEEFNDNLFFVFEKLLMDEKLAERFAECKTEDELYNFCLKIKGGYTKEEWEKFSKIVYKLIFNKKNNKILLDDDLKEISGGNMTNNIGKKALSSTLAALTAATALQIGSVNVSAASNSSRSSISVSKKSSSKWKKIIKGVLIGAGVAAVAAALGYGAYRFVKYRKEKNNTPKDNISKDNQPKINIDQSHIGLEPNKEKNNTPKDSTSKDNQSKINIDQSHIGVESNSDGKTLNSQSQSTTLNSTVVTQSEASNLKMNGIKNVGNSCYLNSIIQQMTSDSKFREYVLNDKTENHPGKEELFTAVQTMLNYAQSGRNGAEMNGQDREHLESVLRKAKIYNGKQQDAGEYFYNIIEDLYPEYKASIVSPIGIPKIPGRVISTQELVNRGGALNVPKAIRTLGKERPDIVAELKEKTEKKDLRAKLVNEFDKLSPRGEFNSHYPLRVVTEEERQSGQLVDGGFYPSMGDRVFIRINRTLRDEFGRESKDNEGIKISKELMLGGKKYKFVGSVIHVGPAFHTSNSLNYGHYTSYTSNDGEKFFLFNDSYSEEVDKSEVLKESGKNGVILTYQLINH